jgi:hypothetical protein
MKGRNRESSCSFLFCCDQKKREFESIWPWVSLLAERKRNREAREGLYCFCYKRREGLLETYPNIFCKPKGREKAFLFFWLREIEGRLESLLRERENNRECKRVSC